MTLTQLKYVVAVAAERHFGRAARRCCISQSALSMAIKELESELGVAIFERARRDVRPTGAGAGIITKAQTALLHCDTIGRLASAASAPLTQPMTVGGCETLASYYLPRLARLLKQRAPDLSLTLAEGRADDLALALNAGKIDVLLATDRVVPGIISRRFLQEPLLAVFSEDNPLARVRALTLDQLAGECLLLREAFSAEIARVFPAIMTAVRHVATVNMSVATVYELIRLERSITIMPLSLVKPAHLSADGLVARPFASAPSRNISLMWRAAFPLLQDVDAIEAVLVNLARSKSWAENAGVSDAILVENNYW